MTEFKMPSAAELYAFEQLARRERAKAQAEILRAAGQWVRRVFVNVFTKPYAPVHPKGVRHA